MSQLRAAGLIVYRMISNRIEYLLMQTSYGGNHWTPPKGHTDPGEDDMQTALRETEEEAGLTTDHLKITDFKRELNYSVNGKPKTVVYWLAKLMNSDTAVKMSDEHQDYRWLPLNEACELAGFSDMQNLLKECECYLKENNL